MNDRNPAVQHCIQSRELAMLEARAKKLERYYVETAGNRAYLDAIPDLCGRQNICDFIACTAHGMLIGAVDSVEGPKFLYAAQVALGAHRSMPEEKSRPSAVLHSPPTPLPTVTTS